MIPGPTPLPDAVRQALGQPAIGHRSPEFKAILKRVFPRLQDTFRTSSDVLMYTASGTGAMEAALINTLNPGDFVLSLTCGVFSERWADIAESLGAVVERISVPYGEANTVESLRERLAQDTEKRIKAVTMIHSETSTGVLNPIPALVAEVKAHGALSIVDTVTGLGSAPFSFDEWGVDIAVSGSQKGFMIPPGLAFLSLSKKAWDAHAQCKHPGYYFNFKKNKKAQDEFTTAYTPATCLIQALDTALAMMAEEGLENQLARHARLKTMVRAGVSAMGLKPVVENAEQASCAVTSVWPPEGVSVADIRAGLKSRFGITVADGQKSLKGKIFRIGHLGYVTEREVYLVLTALEIVLTDLGAKVPVGAAVAAARQVAG
jgi:aspartate aminotransferase-like enzyme